MFDKKELRKAINDFIKINTNCTVQNQTLCDDVFSFAFIENARVSWRRKDFVLHKPKAISFGIPYSEITGFNEYEKCINIELTKRRLVSIRGIG